MSDLVLTNLPPVDKLQDKWLHRKLTTFVALVLAFLYLGSSFAYAQQRTVTGTVTGEGGSPLIGVTVLLKGTSTATATDVNGGFSLPVTGNAATLVVSYIGYVTQEVPVGSQSSVNVNLQTDAKALEEVVVVGYGTQRREDVTGSVATISEENFNRGQVTTPEQYLTGRVAGVQITNNGGAPGSGSTIRIRGGASLGASNDPLIVIDGVPVENGTIAGSPNPLSLINPNDIESFNILKDASAAAIYGSRASNGVIIITTKKGQPGERFKVNFSTLGSIYKITDKVDVLSAGEFRDAVMREKGSDQQALLGNADTDWQDQIYRTAFGVDNNLVFSGSVKDLPYRVSLGYLDQQGTLKTGNLKRSSVALNLNPSFLDDHLRVNLNVRGSLSKSRFADQGAIGSAVAFDPTQPVYSDDTRFGGYFEWADGNGPKLLAPRNPLSMLEQRRDEGEAKRSIGNLQLDYRFHFLPELRANLNVGYDISRSEGGTVVAPTLASGYSTGGSRSQYEQERDNKLLDFYLNYAKDITALKSRVDVTAGYSYQSFRTYSPTFATFNEAGDVQLSEPAPFPNEVENALIGFFGRINYTFNDKYVLTANIRRDGSSRFAPDARWGTFPALAFAWRINEEGFLKNVSAISDLKLRVGYGVTGQQDIGSYYPYLARYTFSENTAMYPFGDQFYNSLRPAGYASDIKWEETKQYNLGLDFGFFNGKFSGTVEYYKKETEDLLGTVIPAAGSNLSNSLFTNVGSLESEGVEVTLNFNPISTENLNWNFGVNGTYTDVTITRLTNVDSENSVGSPQGGISGGTGNTAQVHTVGYTPYAFYVYKQVYNEQGNPVEGVYADLNNDGIINQNDLYRYKSPMAPVYLGFSNDLTYKNFNLNFVLRANLGNYVYNNVFSNNGTYQNINRTDFLTNMSRNVLESNFTGSSAEQQRLLSDYYVQNASFLRMDNISLGYNFGKVAREKVNLRLSATVQNVFVITNYKGLDPEVGGGIDNNLYPRSRVFSLGANLDF
ncbi:SusC/RagA family TonB-linked outer membrane protein [Rufibacter immobilis]|uniref:SusC/RagA family TonB-linked outer membrane protein n=1 Tax=Rufibacter immobilis TaxID=1348778 RepID=UPI0035EE63C6